MQNIRANIVSAITKMLQLNGLNLTELSMPSKHRKSTLSAVSKGKIDKTSTVRLLHIAGTLGLKIYLKVGQYTK